MTEVDGRRGPWILALDVGSSSTRAWLYDRAGRGLDPGPEARRRYRWRAEPPGAMEYDAPALLEAVVAAVDAALHGARAARLEIAAVAVTTFWHSLMGVDAAGAPLTPVFAWGDVRAAGEALRLRAELDEAAIHRRTGCFLHPSFPSVKLARLRREEPGRLAAAHGWISFAEHLEERLFGRRRASFSMASGSGLLDVHRLVWDAAWLERLDLDERRLSPLVDTDAAIRGLLPPFAARWPELAAVPWFPAVGDGACANVGSGAVGPGTLAVTVGTSAAARAVWRTDRLAVPAELWCYRLDARHWVVGQALSNGGNGLSYLRRLLRLDGEREVEAAVAAMEPDSHGLTVLPHLVAERGPGWLRETSATVAGMTLATTPAELVRAWMEAVAYRVARACERIEQVTGPAPRVIASGGALQSSPAWTRILADTLGRDLLLPAEPEATSRGAALVAMERLGWLPDLTSAPVREAVRFEPDPRRHALHRDAMQRQAAAEAAISEI